MPSSVGHCAWGILGKAEASSLAEVHTETSGPSNVYVLVQEQILMAAVASKDAPLCGNKT